MLNNVHALHRRAVLTGAGAAAAALLASTILAEPAPVETARDTIKRAGKEIAEALNHYDGGKWHALIYLSEKVKDGLWLGNRMAYVGLTIEQKPVALIQKWRKPTEVRIPMKPAMHSEAMPATHSDFMPAGIPI